MKKIEEYIKGMCEKCYVIKNKLNDEFGYEEFDFFLTDRAEKYYKNDKMLKLFENLKIYVGEISKEDLKKFLETSRNKYVKIRLQSHPINFSTSPMVNVVRFWDFEFGAEMIKQIDILLSKL
jgi:hypothetical protein